MRMDDLQVHMMCPVKAQNAGLFISRGNTMHPTRVLESHELIFVVKGTLDMWEDDQEFHLEPGYTLHLWPGRKHGSTKPMPSDLRFYWIHFEVDGSNYRDRVDYGDSLTLPIALPQLRQLPRPEGLERLFRIFLSQQEIGILHPHAANLLTTLMLLEVGLQIDDEPKPDEVNIVATWAHTFIRMNFDRSISSRSVAESLGYNVDYLGRVYRQTYGCTLTQAIHRRRIHKACDYLLNSNLTISEIASSCGFSDPDYFRRIFKRYMKNTPSNYRDEYSRLHVITH